MFYKIIQIVFDKDLQNTKIANSLTGNCFKGHKDCKKNISHVRNESVSL